MMMKVKLRTNYVFLDELQTMFLVASKVPDCQTGYHLELFVLRV